MTDTNEATEEQTPTTMKRATLSPDAEEPRDIRLNLLLHAVHVGDAKNVPLTIVVGGDVYMGRVLSLADWRKRSLEPLTEGTPKYNFVSGLTYTGPATPDPKDDEDDAEEEEIGLYPFLHLTEVLKIDSRGLQHLDGITLRFAVDSIDGWGFGMLEPND